LANLLWLLHQGKCLHNGLQRCLNRLLLLKGLRRSLSDRLHLNPYLLRLLCSLCHYCRHFPQFRFPRPNR
jgi:hypothetical protein